MSADLAYAKDYLKRGPPFLGDSSFRHKDEVKKAGGRWNSETSQWKANDEATLLSLIDTGIWMPAGLNASMAAAMKRAIRMRDDEVEQNEMKARAAKEERDSLRKKSTAMADLMVPADEEDLLKDAAEHGVTSEMVLTSGSWAGLGPRSGISNVRRLHRGIRLNILTWEDVVSGRFANSDSSGKKKSTGGGEQGAKGVKRDGKVRVNKGTEQGAKRQRAVGGDGSGEEGVEQDKSRQAIETSRPKPPPQKRDIPTYRYTTTCMDCNTELNSQDQFGLECACSELGMWVSCKRCLIPLRTGSYCVDCDQVKKGQ